MASIALILILCFRCFDLRSIQNFSFVWTTHCREMFSFIWFVTCEIIFIFLLHLPTIQRSVVIASESTLTLTWKNRKKRKILIPFIRFVINLLKFYSWTSDLIYELRTGDRFTSIHFVSFCSQLQCINNDFCPLKLKCWTALLMITFSIMSAREREKNNLFDAEWLPHGISTRIFRFLPATCTLCTFKVKAAENLLPQRQSASKRKMKIQKKCEKNSDAKER